VGIALQPRLSVTVDVDQPNSQVGAISKPIEPFRTLNPCHGMDLFCFEPSFLGGYDPPLSPSLPPLGR
jgi:hypothetical protein